MKKTCASNLCFCKVYENLSITDVFCLSAKCNFRGWRGDSVGEALAALPKDPGSILGTHIAGVGLMPSTDLRRNYTHVHKPIHRHTHTRNQ